MAHIHTIRGVWRHLRCPHCAAPLEPVEASLSCPNGHSFDVARQGYANLLVGRAPAGVDTAEMVDARAQLLAEGHLDPVRQALVEAAGPSAEPGLVVDVGAGTGFYLAAVLDARPGQDGLALDVAKAAARRAAHCHPRAAAVVADAWRGLPLADGCADLVLDVFAPRNGPEFRRILRPTGALLVVTPRPDHLAELVGPLGLIRVDPDKADRLDRSLSGHFSLEKERLYEYELALSRAAAHRLILMGPNAWHAEGASLSRRLATWPEPVTVTASVSVRTYRPRPGAGLPTQEST